MQLYWGIEDPKNCRQTWAERRSKVHERKIRENRDPTKTHVKKTRARNARPRTKNGQNLQRAR